MACRAGPREASRLAERPGEEAAEAQRPQQAPSGAGRSSLARLLEARRGTAQGEAECLEAFLADSVDSILRSEHALSERRRPTAEDVTRLMAPRRRAELVAWLTQSFDILQLGDAILHSVVLTLDRYYASCASTLEDGSLHLVVLAVVCTELKNEGEYLDFNWKRLLSHVCQDKVPVKAILQTELSLLASLDWSVGLPTPLSFLQELGLRLRGEQAARDWLSLASFMLEIALLSPELEYRHPHALLAAGALAAALRVAEAPASHLEDLLSDVAAYGLLDDQELSGGVAGVVLECEEELLQTWMRCAFEAHELSSFFRVLQAKYSRWGYGRVGLLSPAAALARLQEESALRQWQTACKQFVKQYRFAAGIGVPVATGLELCAPFPCTPPCVGGASVVWPQFQMDAAGPVWAA